MNARNRLEHFVFRKENCKATEVRKFTVVETQDISSVTLSKVYMQGPLFDLNEPYKFEANSE